EEVPVSPPPIEKQPTSPEPEPAPKPEPESKPGPTPPPPSPTAKVKPPAAAPKQRAPRRSVQLPSLKLPKDRGALIGLGAGALAPVALVIVLIVGGDGGGSDESATSGEAALTENVAAAAESKNLTQAVLAPTNGGSGAAGRAIFGRFKKKVLLQVTAEGLEPSNKGQMYTIWLYRSPRIALQIGAVAVGDSGKLAAQFEIPVQLLAYVANGAFDQIDVALTDTAEYKAAFAKAKRESKVPPYVGESVLRGPITSPAIKKK